MKHKIAVMLMLCIAMMVPGLVAGDTADAFYATPCPHYSIQDVFDDPNSDWDGDWMSNSNELYNGQNPCIWDDSCIDGGNPLCTYPNRVYVVRQHVSPCQASVQAYPTGDYDNDGVANADEVRNGADPCRYPCPNPTQADLRLNPNGSWDGDGISNAIEVSQGTNPCNGYVFNPCPHWNASHAADMGALDWDGDGFSNSYELQYGYDPCRWNASVIVATTRTHRNEHTNRLPHVSATQTASYVAPPAPKPVAVCPVNYPYYHRSSGKCYANPIGPW